MSRQPAEGLTLGAKHFDFVGIGVTAQRLKHARDAVEDVGGREDRGAGAKAIGLTIIVQRDQAMQSGTGDTHMCHPAQVDQIIDRWIVRGVTQQRFVRVVQFTIADRPSECRNATIHLQIETERDRRCVERCVIHMFTVTATGDSGQAARRRYAAFVTAIVGDSRSMRVSEY